MDISAEIAAIQAASQGSELRQPLVGALNKLNSGSLPAVTALDAGKILKVGANGWEVGEKSGYIPIPSASLNISTNDTYDVTNYAEVVVNVSGGSGSIGPDILANVWKNSSPSVKTSSQGLTITIDNNEAKITVTGTRTGNAAIDVGISNLNASASAALSECFAVVECTGNFNGLFYIQDNTSQHTNHVLIPYYGEATITSIPVRATCFVGFQIYGNTGDSSDFTVSAKIYGTRQANLISKTISINGTYDPADDNADGYSEVTVNVV